MENALVSKGSKDAVEVALNVLIDVSHVNALTPQSALTVLLMQVSRISTSSLLSRPANVTKDSTTM